MMNRSLIILLALCALATAMVPRRGRSPQDSEQEKCASLTPCAWRIYGQSPKEITMLHNTYCSCKTGYTCEEDQDNENDKVYIYRCKPKS